MEQILIVVILTLLIKGVTRLEEMIWEGVTAPLYYQENGVGKGIKMVEARKMLDAKFVADMVKSHEPGLYSSKNNEGETVAVSIDGEHGAVVRTYQNNGWIRVEEYDKNGICELETFDGRWTEGH